MVDATPFLPGLSPVQGKAVVARSNPIRPPLRDRKFADSALEGRLCQPGDDAANRWRKYFPRSTLVTGAPEPALWLDS